jgi:hypothetical protein
MASSPKKQSSAPRKPTTAELIVMPRNFLSLFAAASLGRVTHFFPRFLSEQLNDEPGITPPRVMLMWVLSRSSEPTMGEIAQSLDLTPRAITRLTDGLVQEGLVERIPEASDKRVFRLRLTSSGKKRFKALEPKLQRDFEALFAGLDKKEVRELIRLSEKLSDHIASNWEKK